MFSAAEGAASYGAVLLLDGDSEGLNDSAAARSVDVNGGRLTTRESLICILGTILSPLIMTLSPLFRRANSSARSFLNCSCSDFVLSGDKKTPEYWALFFRLCAAPKTARA